MARAGRPRVTLGWVQIGLTFGIFWSAYMVANSLPYWPINPLLTISTWHIFQLDMVRALWALLPPYGIIAAERMMFGHSRFEEMLRNLVIGAFIRSFGMDPNGHVIPVVDHVTQLDPAALFGRPGVWLGLAVAATSVWLAIQARRHREPV